MSYRLINANDLNGKISEEDYKVVLNAPCIYADLPNGIDNEYHKVPKWIPVSERLPENSGVYIVSKWVSDGVESAILTDANYYDGCGEWYNDNRINWGRDLVTNDIIAWMPLPEPYKEGATE